MKGTIYTFYSYKGGVGRSMALANLAMYFFKKHKLTTLMIDWDLEAPGLQRYFETRYNLNLDEVNNQLGLCDMLNDYMAKAAKPAPRKKSTLPYPATEDYLYEIDEEDGKQLLLMNAGRRAEGEPWQEYARFVQTFDWRGFYEQWAGGIYLEWLRNNLKSMADVILIDSRTGVTEMGGVATQHLADVVVLFCGANLENIENTARMAKNLTDQSVKKARGGRDLDIIVVPSRIDDADSEGYRKFLKKLDESFASIAMPVLDDGYSMVDMLAPYLPAFSFRETLIVDDTEVGTAGQRMLSAYKCIAANMRLLTQDDSVISLPDVQASPEVRHIVYLASAREDSSIGSEIAAYLSDNQLEVRITDPNNRSTVDITDEISGSHFLIVILSKAANKSKFIQKVILAAEGLLKPIIPVLVEESPIPLALAGRKYVDMRSGVDLGLNVILKSIENLRYGQAGVNSTRKPSEKMVYISHASADSKQAQEIAAQLQHDGIQTWMPSEDILPGSRWEVEIESALHIADAMVAVISPDYNNSNFVRNELSYMQHLGKPLIPVLISNAEVPLGLKRFQNIDLTKNSAVEFKKLSKLLHRILR